MFPLIKKLPIKTPRAPERPHRLMTETSRPKQFLSWRSISKRTESLGLLLQKPRNYNSQHRLGCGTTAPSVKRNDDTLGWPPTECCCLPPASLLRANTHFKNLSYIYIALFDSIRRVYFGVIFKGLPFVKMPMSDTVLGVSLHIGSRPANFLDVQLGKKK